MGVDYIARKSAKKRKKKERQAVGKDGIAQRERRRKKIRRLCQGVCYKPPELTEEDKRWFDHEDADAAASDSDIEEAVARANSHRNASTSAAASASATATANNDTKAKTKKNNKKKRKRDAEDDGEANDGGANLQGAKLSTSVQLLDPAALAHNARQAALKKLPTGAKADALERYPPLLQACMLTMHHVEPTPVQERCWPPALEGRDVQGVAEPGSGKTLTYLLPGLVKLQAGGHTATTHPEGPVMVVLLPTRELAQQVAVQCRAMRAVTGLRAVCVFGGAPREEQAALLASKQPHVLVATPGRALDLVDGGELKLQGHVQYLVLDEADKMLSLGFKPQLDRLYGMLLQPYDKSADDGTGNPPAAYKKKSAKAKAAKEVPPAATAATSDSKAGAADGDGGRRPQVLLFSATMPADVTAAAAQWLRRPEVVQVSASGANAISRTVTQVVHVCAEHKKPDKVLKHLARIRDSVPPGSRNPPRLLVFANRVKTVRFLATTLAKEGYKVAQLHGQRSQVERNQAVSDFRSGKAQVLVATDVAARGLDIRALPYVVNYDFPSQLETYVHRVGRTGRLAAYGHAYSFFTRNLAPLAPHLLELLQTHDQAVDPNLAALAAAWKVAEQKLGRKGAAAAAAAVARSADGTTAPADGEGEDENGEDDDEGDGAAAAASCGGLSLAEEVLLAADDLMEGLGLQDARAIAALMKKKLSRNQQQRQKNIAGESRVDADDDGDGTRPSKKQHRRGEENGAGNAKVVTGGAEAEAQRRAKKAGDAQLVPRPKEQHQWQAMQQQKGADGPQRAAAFVSAAAFEGAMAGYVFKRGALGLGYYLDQQKQGQQQAAAGQQGKAALPVAPAAVPGPGKKSTPAATAAPAVAAAAAVTLGKGAIKAAPGKPAGGAATAAWGLPSRNKPIIPVRHSDFLSDSEGSGGSKSDPDSDWDDSEPGSDAPFRNAAVNGDVKAKAKAKEAGAIAGGANTQGGPGNSRGRADDAVDDDGADEYDEPLEGQRAAAKRRFKSLPGRLRKKLRKGQVTGQPQRPQGASAKKTGTRQ